MSKSADQIAIDNEADEWGWDYWDQADAAEAEISEIWEIPFYSTDPSREY